MNARASWAAAIAAILATVGDGLLMTCGRDLDRLFAMSQAPLIMGGHNVCGRRGVDGILIIIRIPQSTDSHNVRVQLPLNAEKC